MPDFIPGLELSRQFFAEAVMPVLDDEFPDLRYDAALIDSGSEVLGFDTERSRDHHWGPRASIFVSEDDAPKAKAIRELLRHRLPYTFRGYPTSFEEIPGEPGVLRFEERTEGEVNHRVSVGTLREFMLGYLGFDLNDALTPADWLTFPQQKLRTLTHGAVYYDGRSEVGAMRRRLEYYPRDVWLYLLAAQWTRISQEEPFVGRAGDVGDDLGSRVIAARLVRDVMMLCFLMERVYAPYPKWFGTGFARLKCAPDLTPHFQRAFAPNAWHERQMNLCSVYHAIAEMHNDLAITERLSTMPTSFHGRPYFVIHGEVFSAAILKQIDDPEVVRIAAKTMIGSMDQFSDSTDLRDHPSLRAALKGLYQ